MRVVEKELTERPREHPDVEQECKFRQVGRVTQAMRTRLEEAIDMNTEAQHFVIWKRLGWEETKMKV
jgi:hypothetical protein